MQPTISGKNIEVTDALKNAVYEKFEKIAERFQRVTKADVILHVDNVTQIAEGTLHIDGHEMHAKAESKDMYRSIHDMIEKLEHQLTKHKEKIIDDHR